MTGTTRALARPHVDRMILRSGEQAVTITAADQRVIVLQRHLAAFIEDVNAAWEDEQ